MIFLTIALLQVCWVNPDQNVDATPLDDLVSITLHWGVSSGSYTDTLVVPTSIPGDEACADIPLTAGDYFFAGTATNVQGDISAFSNEVIKTVDAVPDAPFILELATQPGAVSEQGELLIGVTGSPVTLQWGDVVGTKTAQVVQYGSTVPVATGTFTGASWTFTPPRAGLFFSRVRLCDTCDWINSYDQGFLFYFKLAAPSGGGLN